MIKVIFENSNVLETLWGDSLLKEPIEAIQKIYFQVFRKRPRVLSKTMASTCIALSANMADIYHP
jgi:hypothetical protein